MSNLLLGAHPLPEKVTATRLAPVWLSYGTAAPYRVGLDGDIAPVTLNALETVPVNTTRVIRLFMECEILELCDLIDFPGISDPNMPSIVWERLLPEVDAVIWCTHATQAWRQSEAAVWDTMPASVRDFSVLLITRYDKLINDTDRRRVFQRVRRETDGQFAATFPISLVQALQAGDDLDKWNASGAGPFVTHLVTMIEKLARVVARASAPLYNVANGTEIPKLAHVPVTPRRVIRDKTDDDSDRAQRISS